MFYDETKTMKAVEEDPSLIFELIREGHIELVDKILKKKLININTVDEAGNDILYRLLKHGNYETVIKHMGNKEWDVNHQNSDGNTFAHVLVVLNYVNVVDIIGKLKKNKLFIPNIKNNNGETILDKSINENYIYTTVKILEDSRFNNIDIVSFKNLYDTYIKSNKYGKYSKLTNLEMIIENLVDKPLLPRMEQLMDYIKSNFDMIKEEVFSNKLICIEQAIDGLLIEE